MISSYKSLRAFDLFFCFVLVTSAVAGTLLFGTTEAQAQDRPLLIVPFDKEGVDQTFYDQVMTQVRKDADKSPEYQIIDIPADSGGMTELLFTVGCAEVDNECLQLIGESFGVEAIMWGQLWKNERTSFLEVRMFDVLSGTYILEPPVERSIETDDAEKLKNIIIGEFQQIFFPYTGEIEVTATEDDAVIFFDGTEAGNTNDGPLTLSGRPLGEHTITARVGDKEVTESVVLLFDQKGKIEIDMSKADDPNAGFAYTGTVVSGSIAGVFLVTGSVFALLVNSKNSEIADLGEKPTLSANEANDLLSSGKNFQTLQFVSFGIGAAALVTSGVFYFLESGDAGAAEQASGDTFITPFISNDGTAGAAIGGTF